MERFTAGRAASLIALLPINAHHNKLQKAARLRIAFTVDRDLTMSGESIETRKDIDPLIYSHIINVDMFC